MEKQQENRIYTFPQDESRPRRQSSWKLNEEWLLLTVRGIGITLLLLGLWAAAYVMLEALQLYRDPARVEQLAGAIEHGSNLDRTLAPRTGEDSADKTLRLSYFFAWVITLMLLIITSMIASSAIKTGGDLVLQDKRTTGVLQKLAGELNALRNNIRNRNQE